MVLTLLMQVVQVVQAVEEVELTVVLQEQVVQVIPLQQVHHKEILEEVVLLVDVEVEVVVVDLLVLEQMQGLDQQFFQAELVQQIQ
jgi:hypothetical protein